MPTLDPILSGAHLGGRLMGAGRGRQGERGAPGGARRGVPRVRFDGAELRERGRTRIDPLRASGGAGPERVADRERRTPPNASGTTWDVRHRSTGGPRDETSHGGEGSPSERASVRAEGHRHDSRRTCDSDGSRSRRSSGSAPFAPSPSGGGWRADATEEARRPSVDDEPQVTMKAGRVKDPGRWRRPSTPREATLPARRDRDDLSEDERGSRK